MKPLPYAAGPRVLASLSHDDSRGEFPHDADRERLMNAAATSPSQPRFLMCRPRHFAVTYSINPWMDPGSWAGAHAAEAQKQWAGLEVALRAAGAALEFVESERDLPDLVFTANAAVVLNGKALLARFRHPERVREEPYYAAAFRRLQASALIDDVVELPQGVVLEGAGDCIYDATRGMFWMGCGQRSDGVAAAVIDHEFGLPCVAVELASASFYHLDTCFSVLPCGALIYYPQAFTPTGLALIHEYVPAADRIPLERADAEAFAANAVVVGRKIVMSSASDTLKLRLAARGYGVVTTPLTAFLRSGGSACCLTLRLDHRLRGDLQPALMQRRASL